MLCQEFRELMDSYLSDELLIETNHEVLQHLENCPTCRNELAARRELLMQMRSAVKSAKEMQLNPAFATRLRKDLRQTALRPPVWSRLQSGVFINSPILAASVAACLLFAVFAAIWFNRSSATDSAVVVQQNQTNESIEIPRPTESPLTQAVKIAWQEIMQSAAGDHENCALHFRLKEDPITLKEAAEKYGRFNKDLDKAVIASLQTDVSDEKKSGKPVGKLEFYDAHSCIFNGRQFTHIELRRGNKTISLLVTDDSSVETDFVTTQQAVDNFNVAGIRTMHHAIFVVSDLSERENLRIAEMLFPAVRRHIEQAEA